jgi:hypothetical protein
MSWIAIIIANTFLRALTKIRTHDYIVTVASAKHMSKQIDL